MIEDIMVDIRLKSKIADCQRMVNTWQELLEEYRRLRILYNLSADESYTIGSEQEADSLVQRLKDLHFRFFR